eukprot:gene13797-biopygen8678
MSATRQDDKTTIRYLGTPTYQRSTTGIYGNPDISVSGQFDASPHAIAHWRRPSHWDSPNRNLKASTCRQLGKTARPQFDISEPHVQKSTTRVYGNLDIDSSTPRLMQSHIGDVPPIGIRQLGLSKSQNVGNSARRQDRNSIYRNPHISTIHDADL